MDDIRLLNSAGINKVLMANDDPVRYFMRAFMAGLYLGGAMILSYSLSAILVKNYPEYAKIAYAFTFGIGLVAICFLGGDLFTGNCLTTIIPVFDKKLSFREVIPTWILCYIGNCVGMAFIAFLFIKSGSLSTQLSQYIEPMLESKLHFDFTQLLIKGVLCNFLVCIAGYAGIKIKDDMVRLIMIMAFVAAFVVPSFDHCIANVGFFAMCITSFGTNAAQLSTILVHLAVSTLGNIIGGAIIAGIPVYIMFKSN